MGEMSQDTQTPDEDPVALRLTDISMAFGANQVLKGVTMDLHAGAVTALLGANGAGKSTLIKILAGVYQGNGGQLEVAGEPITIASPREAGVRGIQTVHQRIDDSIVPGLTVAENLLFEEIVTGEVPRIRSLGRLLPRAREVAATLDLGWSDAKLKTDVHELGIADCQMLLLARALIHRPKVLVLDEPTSTLSQHEAELLFEVVRRLRDEGVAILYVSHHLSEIKSLADKLVVLRDGRIHDEQSAPLDLEEAVQSMLGPSVATAAEQLDEQRGTEVAIELRQVQLLKRSAPFDLQLRYGEVTGIVGLIGAGKSELARGIYGADRLRAGTMVLDDKPYRPRRTSDAVARGIYLVPEDRAHESLLPGWSLARTISLPFIAKVARTGLINFRAEHRRGQQVIDEFGVISTGPDQPVDDLSGGNQQKAVVGRWMLDRPKVLLLDEPFRGVDIGARRDLSGKARESARSGACVVVFSSDVDEIKEVADRILVIVEGQIVLDAYSSEVDNEAIVKSMSEVA